MEARSIARKFVLLNGNKETIELEDINPELTGEQVMGHYAQLYPELTNANIVDNGIKEGFHLIEFQSLAGTKG